MFRCIQGLFVDGLEDVEGGWGVNRWSWRKKAGGLLVLEVL